MIFSIVLSRTPKSANAKGRFLVNYQQRMADDANAKYKSAAVVSDRLYPNCLVCSQKGRPRCG